MATPSYTEDLTDITLAETITGWTALGGGSSGLGAGADFAMQGTNCVDKAVTASEKGQIYNFGTTITPGADTHFFVWVFLATPGLANTLANRGLAIIVGTGTTAYNAFHVEGSDTYGAVGRVGKCYPIRYVTSANGSVPYRTLTGTPGANPQYFGATTNITGAVKGANLGVDAIRYGTGIYITAGDSGDPATFTGAAAQNDAIANRWGILTFLGGSTFELQGRFVVGQTNAGTPTLAYFSDSNKSILIVDTPHTLSDFTQIVFDHASTQVYLTAVTIEAAGTNNRGRVVFNNASTVATLTNCVFSKLGPTTLRAGVDAIGCTWQLTDAITLNGASLTGCNILESFATSAVITSTLANLDGCTFDSDGTGHAVDLGTIAASTSMNWNCTDTGYAATNGSTGNETILVNVAASQTLTINVAAGASIPTYRNTGAGTVNVVSGQVTTTITVRDVITSTVIEGARVYLFAGAGGPLSQGTVIFNTTTDVNGQVSDIRSLASDQPVTGWVRKSSSQPFYKNAPITGTIDNATGLSLTVQLIPDE